MTQEEKDLLIKDLCARLPYGVKVLNTTYRNPEIQTLFGRISEEEFSMRETYKQVGGEDYRVVRDNVHYTGYIETIRPYLRPMSSMTAEEFELLKQCSGLEYDQLNLAEFSNNHKCLDFYLSEIPSYVVILVFDWLNAHHFDYRGLIEEGLALEAPEGMYKF